MGGVRMSDPWLRAVRPSERPVDYSDTETRGLILRVETSGRKSWAVRYVFGGQRRRFLIGTYPEVPLSQARRKAAESRGSAFLGTDVQGDRQKLRLGETVSEVSVGWLVAEDTRHWRGTSRASFETHLRLRLLPGIGAMKLAEVKRAHIQAVLDSITRVHTRNRTFEVARMLFGWAVKRELIEASPCAGIEKLREAKRTRTLSDAEIRQVIGAFDATGLAELVRLLFLTGVRRDEGLGARWQDIDFDRQVWTIPPAAEKTGEGRAEARKVALSQAAVKTLGAQRERNMARGLGTSAYVFPGPSGMRLDRNAPKPVVYVLRGRQPNGKAPSTHKLAKPRPMQIPMDFRLHDVRRTVADRMLNDLGLSAYIVDVGVLGHAKPKMLGVYAPSVPLKELRDALETWARELARILGSAPALPIAAAPRP